LNFFHGSLGSFFGGKAFIFIPSFLPSLSSAVPVVVECFLSECNPFCKLIIFGFSFSSISNSISVICNGSFGSCYGFSPGISSFSIMIFSFVGCVGCFNSGGSRFNSCFS